MCNLNAALIALRQQRRMSQPYASFRLTVSKKLVGIAHNCNFSVTFRFQLANKEKLVNERN